MTLIENPEQHLWHKQAPERSGNGEGVMNFTGKRLSDGGFSSARRKVEGKYCFHAFIRTKTEEKESH